MPTIAQRQPAPQLIKDSLPLPTKFPDLPPDLLKRFPSLAEWEENKNRWWRRAFVALQDNSGSVSQTVTNTRAGQDTLRAQFISTSGTFAASLATEITIRAGETSALATRATNLEASVDTPGTGLLARVTIIETTFATTTSVSAAISAAISAEVTNRNTAISASASSLTASYVAADSVLNTALGTRISNLEASVDTPTTGLLARVSTIESVYTSTTYVTASISTAISSEVTNRNSAISSSASSVTSAYTAADGALNTALSGSISSLTSVVNTKAKITVAGSAPSSPATGDLWLDTSDQNKYKFWDGAAWQYKQDLVLAAQVTAEGSTRAGADGYLSGKYTLTVAAGNVVTGMNITSSTGTGTDISDVTFVAANFKIYNGTTGVTMFNVSGSTVLLANTLTVSTSGKVFIGTGTYANTNTAFYVDSTGQFSLKDKLTWDGTTLNINGGGTFTGALSAATGTFSGALSAASGSFSGSVTSTSGTIGGFTLSSSGFANATNSLIIDNGGTVQIGASSSDHTTWSGGGFTYATSTPNTMIYMARGGASNWGYISWYISGSPYLTISGGETNFIDSTPFKVSKLGDVTNTRDAVIGRNALISGIIEATGYSCRSGLSGSYSGNRFNFYWNGSSQLEVWIDTTKIGTMNITP